MPIELKMPALSPTMEEGTLAKWLVKEGDTVGRATSSPRSRPTRRRWSSRRSRRHDRQDRGARRLGRGEGRNADRHDRGRGRRCPARLLRRRPKLRRRQEGGPKVEPAPPPRVAARRRLLLRRPLGAESRYRRSRQGIAARPPTGRGAGDRSVDVNGSGPDGRIVRADLARPPAARGRPGADPPAAPAGLQPVRRSRRSPTASRSGTVKLSNMRKAIANRLTKSKQPVPHIYLTLDCRLDALLKLRGDLNAGLASRGVKLSVNDMLIKALALALIEVPECNVSFAGDQLIKYQPRRHFGRGQHPRWADHADHRRCREQVAVENLDRDAGPRRPRQGGQAAAARISGRHRKPLQHGHVRDQAFRGGDQSAPGDDHGDRRGREAALCDRRLPCRSRP